MKDEYMQNFAAASGNAAQTNDSKIDKFGNRRAT
jgi:hypothetical protein